MTAAIYLPIIHETTLQHGPRQKGGGNKMAAATANKLKKRRQHFTYGFVGGAFLICWRRWAKKLIFTYCILRSLLQHV